MSKAISASDRFISDHQLDAQEKIVDLELLRLESSMVGLTKQLIQVTRFPVPAPA